MQLCFILCQPLPKQPAKGSQIKAISWRCQEGQEPPTIATPRPNLRGVLRKFSTVHVFGPTKSSRIGVKTSSQHTDLGRNRSMDGVRRHEETVPLDKMLRSTRDIDVESTFFNEVALDVGMRVKSADSSCLERHTNHHDFCVVGGYLGRIPAPAGSHAMSRSNAKIWPWRFIVFPSGR